MKIWLLMVIVPLLITTIISGCARSPASSTSPAITTPPSGTTSTTESPSIANGRSIYLYASSDSGERITYTNGPSGMMMNGQITCAYCHGSDGHGGTVFFMMQSYDIPNITWTELTGPDPDMEHPPYTEETLKMAIIQGVDPGGKSLEYPMPRWVMSQQDLNDLAAFIMTLK
jgi:cytochrome c oxidase subunit II